MELLFVLLVLVAVVYGIIKDYNPQAVLALAGMAIFAVAYWLGLHPIILMRKGTPSDVGGRGISPGRQPRWF